MIGRNVFRSVSEQFNFFIWSLEMQYICYASSSHLILHRFESLANLADGRTLKFQTRNWYWIWSIQKVFSAHLKKFSFFWKIGNSFLSLKNKKWSKHVANSTRTHRHRAKGNENGIFTHIENSKSNVRCHCTLCVKYYLQKSKTPWIGSYR